MAVSDGNQPSSIRIWPAGFGSSYSSFGSSFSKVVFQTSQVFFLGASHFGLPIIDGGLSEVQHLLQMFPRQKKTTQCSHLL